VSLLYLLTDSGEIARRRALLPAGAVVEAWADLYMSGHVWVGAASMQLLASAGPPLASVLTLEGERVPVFYGPRLADLDSLPPEESLRARVLSAHGMAVVWITLDQFGERSDARADSPLDPTFFLRCRGGATAHIWRLFRNRTEAGAFMRERYGGDAEAQAWAQGLQVADFDELIARHAVRVPPRAP
jgi:hypothetical protein